MPRALGVLEANPLAEGDCYEGDLLKIVFILPETYWESHPEHLVRALNVALLTLKKLDFINEKRRKISNHDRSRAWQLYGARLEEKKSNLYPDVRKWAEDFLKIMK